MSLILDALRKADLERTPGERTGREAQGLKLPENRARSNRWRTSRLIWLLLVVMSAGIAVIRFEAEPEAHVHAAEQSAAMPMATTQTLTADAPTARPIAATPLAEASIAAPKTRVTSARSLPLLSKLPQSTRKAIPALSINGKIYSPRATERSVIVDGQVRRERDLITTDLIVERIETDSVIFRYKEQRFRVPD